MNKAAGPPLSNESKQYWKRRVDDSPGPNATPIAVVVIVLLLLFAVGFLFIPKQIESTVGDSVTDSLRRMGLGTLDVSVDGQDVEISGRLPSERLNAEIPKLHAIARGVTCEVPIIGEIVCPNKVYISIEEQAPETALAQDVSSSAQQLPNESEAQADSEFFQFHDFSIHKDKDFITIDGAMPSPRVRDLMLRRGTKFGVAVIDEMQITNTPSSAYFAWAIERAWAVARYLETGTASWSQGKFSVNGQITSDQADLVKSAYNSEFFAAQLAGMNLDVRPVYNDVETCNQAFADVLGNASIEFAPESAKILAASEVLLDRIAVLAEQCTLPFVVENHTGQLGAEENNLALSQRRAETVLNALVSRGIAKARLTAQGFGGSKPLKNNNTPKARMLNRRTNIVAKQ